MYLGLLTFGRRETNTRDRTTLQFLPRFLCNLLQTILNKYSVAILICNIPDPPTSEEDATKHPNIWVTSPINMIIHIMLKQNLEHTTN